MLSSASFVLKICVVSAHVFVLLTSFWPRKHRMPTRSVCSAVFRGCYLTNNILGAAPPAEKQLEMEMDELDETDVVPDLPRLPRTFLAHHASGIRAPTVSFFLQNWRDLHTSRSTNSSSVRTCIRKAQPALLVLQCVILLNLCDVQRIFQ